MHFHRKMKPARIIVVESQGLPTMKCQTKCAKAIFGGRFLGTVTTVPRGTAVTGQLGVARCLAIGSWA